MKNDKNGGGISIRKRYIFKKCEKIKRACTFLESFGAGTSFFKNDVRDIFEISTFLAVKNGKNGGGISIRKRYISKKCEKIKRAFVIFLIFLRFVMVKKKNGGKNVRFSNSKKLGIS